MFDFNRFVMHPTQYGDGTRMNSLDDLTDVTSAFDAEDAEEWAKLVDGNKVQAFIFTPFPINADPDEWPWPPSTLRYGAYITKLKDMLDELIPSSKARIERYPMDYTQPDAGIQWDLKNTPRGKVFAQYDPEKTKIKVTKKLNGQDVECDVARSGLRIFAEDGRLV